jgi:O-antigen ligase
VRSGLWDNYRAFLVIFVVAVFFTYFSDYTERFGVIPLYWIMLFGALAAPLALHGALSQRIPIPPLLWWALFYLDISIVWFYRTDQDAFAYQEVRKRILSMLFLMLGMIVFSREREQRIGRQMVALGVLLATALNIYELFHPLTFSTIPGRSTGLYSNVNQSGAALVLGLILSFHVIPNRLKPLFLLTVAVGIVPTFSRSAMIAYMVVVGYFFMRDGLIVQLRRVVVLIATGVALVFSPIWKDLQQSLENRGALNLNVLQRVSFFTQGNTSDASSNERRAVAARAWQLFGDHPVLGWGTGASRRIEGFEVGTHNIYLAMLVDHGIMGIFVIPGLLLAVIWGANRKTIDLTIPYLLFMVIWGFFSHNVLEERYILLASALLASIVMANRTAPARESTPLLALSGPEPAVAPTL